MTVKNRLIRFLFALLLVGGVTAVTVLRTQAHASVAGSDPADNAILDEAPREIKIWFTEPVAVDFSAFRVLDINGQIVELTGIQRDEADHKIITLELPELASGVYSVHWNVLSEADGHDTKGVIAFGVGGSVDLSAAHTAATETAVPWLEVVLRWVNFSLLAVIPGAIAAYFLVLNRSKNKPNIGPAIREAQTRILKLAERAVIAAFIVGFLLLLNQVNILLQSLPDSATFGGTGWKLITLSRWGNLWAARQIILPVILVFLRFIPNNAQASHEKLAGMMAAFFTVALIAVQSLNSHAAAVARYTNLAVAVDALHLIGVGLWLGGLFALMTGLLPLLRRDRQQFTALARAGWGAFGRLAAFSVALIILTGVYNTGRQVATVDALISVFYGQALLSKIGLMLGMGVVGLLNAMLLHPRAAAPLARLLRRPQGWTPLSLSRLPQLVMIEASIGVLVLLAAGLVTAAAAPQGPEFIPFDRGRLLDSMTDSVDDMLISFSAKPNTPGQNVFLIRATSARRPAPAEVLRVIVRLTNLDEDNGTTAVDAQEISEGEYHIGGSYFSLPGDWLVEVAVRRSGMEDTVAQFIWVVPPAVEARELIVSNQPLEPILTGVGLLGLGALTFITAVYALRRRKTAVPPPSLSAPTQLFASAYAAAQWRSLTISTVTSLPEKGEKNE